MKTHKTPSIYLSQTDYDVINLLLRRATPQDPTAALLRQELARAVVLEPAAVPGDCIGLNSVVKLLDLDTQETETQTLTLPTKANADLNRVSILAPVGAALLGYRVGDELEWPVPEGVRRLKVLEVEREPAPSTKHPPYGLAGGVFA